MSESKELTIRDRLQSPALSTELARVLPTHVTPDRMVRVALTAMTRTPKLAQCDQASFFRCLLDLASLGLEPDGRRAHLIPFENKKRNCVECQLIIDYKGLVELAGRPLVEHVLDALRPQVGTLVISANRHLDRYAAYGHQVVSDTLQVCEAAVRAGAEHVAVTVCQLLTDLLEISAPLLARHLPAIVTACLAMGTAASLELDTREQALQVLHWVATYKPKQLCRSKELVREVVTRLCAMTAEPPPADWQDDDEQLPPSKMATQVTRPRAHARRCTPLGFPTWTRDRGRS